MYERARVTIRVESLDRSIDYYTGKLGFLLHAKHGSRLAELEAPGLTLMLHQRFDAQPVGVPSGVIAVSLEVPDIAEARRRLEARGIVFEGETVEFDSLKFAFTTDPDGVPVHLLEANFLDLK